MIFPVSGITPTQTVAAAATMRELPSRGDSAALARQVLVFGGLYFSGEQPSDAGTIHITSLWKILTQGLY